MRNALELANLSLDFLNPESRRIGGIYRNYGAARHANYLDRLLNLHALWCGEFCITQAGAVFECAHAEAALKRKIRFLQNRIIRVPFSDLDPAKFLTERRREYKQNKEYFPDLFQDRDFLITYTPEAIIPKLSPTGPSLAENWEGAFASPNEQQVPRWLKDSDLNLIRSIGSIPSDIIKRGDTLTWPDLRRELTWRGMASHNDVPRNWLQHVYLSDYADIFGLRSITNVPGMFPDLGKAGKRHFGYDYHSIKGVLEFWGLFDAILELRDEHILEIRRGAGFFVFRAAFEHIGGTTRSATQLRQRFATAYPKLDSRRAPEILQKLSGGKARTVQTGIKLLDEFFLDIGSLVRKSELRTRPFVEKSGSKIRQRQGDLFYKSEAFMKKRVFIGHGRSTVWHHLKELLEGRLKLQVDEFNSRPTAGITTIDRLDEMLNAAGFAFLILTAEDERVDGAKQARMNVVHEVGLFQGKLGFRKAIVLLEEGCEEFTNIVGLGQIRFPSNDIMAKSEEIRRVLEREGILPP